MTLRKTESDTASLNRLALVSVLLIGFVLGLVSFNIPAAQIKQEYFVRQEADEALLIRISAYEAEVEASVFAPERILLMSSAMQQSRLVPVFQFINTTDKPRQLELEVTSSLSTANSKFDIEFTRLSSWDNRSATLERAYRLLSFGMQSSNATSAADWTVKINSLMRAGATFGQYGMLELRLWSDFLVAHLVQHRLHDYNMVLGLTREILADTRGTRWQDIELAALQLRSAALIGLRRSGALQTSASDPDPVQTALLNTVQRAEAMGYRFEKAQAIYQSGLDYKDRSLYAMALEQFQVALEIADAIGDDVLAKGIRESIAQIHAGQGDDPATNKVLQEIETQLAADGGGDELALNLLQQGRIFIRNYRYPQAIEVLNQALGFENDSSIRTQVNLELARAHFETGQSDIMMVHLQAAGISKPGASSYFQQSYRASLSDTSSLRHAAEAAYLKARSLAREGRRGEALEKLEQLIDQVLFLRQSLPGVLGAWYMERHEDLMEDYLGLQVADGAQALLALSKIRYSAKSPQLTADTGSLRALLAQRDNAEKGGDLRQVNSGINQRMKVLQAQFNTEFNFLSKTGLQTHLSSLGTDEAVLTYHLTASTAHVWVAGNGKVKHRKLSNARELYTLLRNGVTGLPLPTKATFDSLMDTLGEHLLGPVADLLPETVYMIPSGLLLSLPMDALRLNNRYLVERHTIVNLMSFPSNPDPGNSLMFGKPENILVAGDPQDFYGGFANRLESSAEIQAVAEIFIGPGLYIIQGAALLADEFEGEQFKQASLVHLTMPGIIDLGYENHSSLQLSEPLRGLGRSLLRPVDIRSLQMNANLVYLGATQVAGTPASDVASQIAIISDFLNAGADSVIARLWSTQNESTEWLLTRFYKELDSTGNVATALTETKRQYLRMQQGAGLHDWMALQLFIN